jgi:tRNA dimethylallyltransferase
MDPSAVRAALVAADPEAAAHVDLENPRRIVRALEILRLGGGTPTQRARTPEARALAAYEPKIPFLGVGVDPGDAIGGRVERRFDAMLAAGLLDEVGRLRHRLGPTARQAVGYKELIRVVDDLAVLADARDAAVRATHALVKRQRTYFRRDPRIRWLPWQDGDRRRVDDALTAIEEQASWTS